MEGKKAENEEDYSGESSSVMVSTSPENLPVSAAAQTSVNGNIGTSAETDIRTEISTGEFQETNTANGSDDGILDQETVVADSETSSKLIVHGASSNVDDKCSVQNLSSVAEHSSVPKVVSEASDESKQTDSEMSKKFDNPNGLSSGAFANGSTHSLGSSREMRTNTNVPNGTVDVHTTAPTDLNYRNDVGIVKENRLPLSESDKQEIRRGLVDTAAPFESVKEAVTKFGGIVDWKAHKKQAIERRKQVKSELDKVQQEIPEHKKQSETAENDKEKALKELENTKKIIEELTVHLERAQTEEAQVRQDSELAQLRIKEMEQGIVEESSIVLKTQQEVAKARHEAAIAELNSAKEELTILLEKYSSLVSERDSAIKQAEESVSSAKEIEKTVDSLTLELIAIKESIESAHASHSEAEEHRIGSALARDQDLLTWEKELKQTDEQIQRLTQQLSTTKDIKSKLDEATSALSNLKAELSAYMEAKLNRESGEENPEGEEDPSLLEALNSTRTELEEVKASVERAKEEVKILKAAALSLKSELEKEKGALINLQQREGMASVAVYSVEAELDKTKQELEVVKANEKETRSKMIELPKLLQKAAQEAEEAKSEAQSAQQSLKKAKELAEQVTARASMTDIRLQAALKEIEAAEASEKLALSAIKALEESEQMVDRASTESETAVTLPLSQYFRLSEKAHEAEELAHELVMSATAQIEEAKRSELRSLRKLEDALTELNMRKETLRVAKEKAEKAKDGKLSAEQDLRKWRAESERRRRNSDAAKAVVDPLKSRRDGFEQNYDTKSSKQESDVFVHPLGHDEVSSYTSESSPGSDVSESKVRKKKKTFFPQILRYLASRNQR